MLLRGDAPPRSMLRDIGDCIAHEERDRGWAYGYITTFAERVIDALGSGGVLEVGICLEITGLLQEVADMCQGIGLPLSLPIDAEATRSLADTISDVLAGTRIRLGRDDVTAEFAGLPHPSMVLYFAEGTVTGVVPLPPNVGLAMPLLRDVSEDPT